MEAQARLRGGSGRSGYLPTLDGWRAVAIGLVLLQHAGGSAGVESVASQGGGLEARVFQQGRLGVEIFFAISGFLITSKLVEEWRTRERIRLGDFYKRRVFRIYPAALCYVVALVMLRLMGEVYLPTRHVVAAVGGFANYVNYVFHDSWTWYLGHFWSLAVEEHFYLIWPGVLALVGIRRGVKVAGVLAVAIVVWRVVAGLVLHQTMDESYFERTDICADGLLWGCIVAVVSGTGRGRKWMEILSRPVVWWGLAGATLWYAFFSPEGNWRLVGNGGLAVVLAVLVAGTVMRPGTVVGRMLEWRVVRWIGRLSYSLYLWQQLFLVAWQWRSARMGVMQKMPVNVGCAFCCALVSYYCIERPMLRVGHSVVGRRGGRGKAAEIAQRENMRNVAINSGETVAATQGM